MNDTAQKTQGDVTAEELLAEWGRQIVQPEVGLNLGGTTGTMYRIQRYSIRPKVRGRRKRDGDGNPLPQIRPKPTRPQRNAPAPKPVTRADRTDRVLARLHPDHSDWLDVAIMEWGVGPMFNVSQSECARKLGISTRTYRNRVTFLLAYVQAHIHTLEEMGLATGTG